MFLSRNKKNNVYPYKTKFYCIKVGFKGVKIIEACFHDEDITKTYLYNFDPLKPHFYIVKLGFTGVYIIFLISAQNINCGYSLEPSHRIQSMLSPHRSQSMLLAEIWKNRIFYLII